MRHVRHHGAMALGLCALAAAVFPGGAQAQAPTPIRVGEQVTGTLTATDPRANDRGAFRVYRFDARPGQRLSIRMASNDFDAYLSVGRTVAGITDYVANDDDGGGGTDARIRFSPPRGGEYLIVAQSLDTARAGAYTLVLDTLPTPVIRPPVALRVGQTVRGALEESDPTAELPEEVFYDLYTIAAAAGQRLQFDMRSPDLDSYLEIGRMQGGELEVLRYNDDVAAPTATGDTLAPPEMNLDSRLVFTAPAAGTYTLRARALGGGALGGYTLSVTQLPPLRVPVPRPVAVGATVEGALASDDAQNDEEVHYDAYLLRGRAGEAVEITLESEAFDPYLSFGRMQGGVFQEIASNDDGENGLGSLLRVTLDRNGEYVIRAQSLSPQQTGAYTLVVRAGAR